MDMEVIGGDMSNLDPELLQLSEVSPIALKSNIDLAEELYSQWLSLPETTRLVKTLLKDAKEGVALNVTGNSSSSSPSMSNSLPSMFPAGTVTKPGFFMRGSGNFFQPIYK
ncbi:hypothetical protein ACHQM5_016429 [Ranunculus cassubicifolius]